MPPFAKGMGGVASTIWGMPFRIAAHKILLLYDVFCGSIVAGVQQNTA
ncbi:MAG: hypothetical protein PSY12_01960 [bacterium]|nr:hypothetical protein [bacterium]